jgi:hypothetical protein
MKHPSLGFIAFLQATGVVLYCGLIGFAVLNGNRWFGPTPPSFLNPLLFLTLFIFSAVLCSLIFLGYPFMLFWEHKKTREALRLVFYSSAWLFFYLFAIILAIFILK